ncbi:unnamed protein product [Ostreobium quekettii]|uniref:EGF-like domain-containing protein n=1 Tax=Ostreobium quekettii TaxID=121088 RepID=A0A8S1J9W7_9CHLO|nr:unnamed protein product [Ostreobium quekettii]
MDFEKSIQEYDIGSVFVKAVWIGPTRERISGSRFVRLQKSELSVSLLMSMDIQDIPGVEFGVAAFVDSALSGAISGELVQISLLQVNDSKSGVGDVQLALMEQCTAASGDITAMSLCRMALPSIGHFALRGCIDDSDGKVCATIELGKNFSEWIERPLASHPNLRIVAQGQDQDIFTAVGQFGKEFEVFVDVPFHNTTFLVLFGNTLKREKMVMRFPDPGVHKMAVPLGRECLGGCSVKVLMAIPRQTSLGLDVPTSVGFDPLGTHWVDRRFNIRIPEVSRELTVNVTIAPPNPSESPREEDELVAISPGENATVQVLVAKCQGDPNAGTSFSCNEREPAANAKVLVIAVDKALLQLMPNALVNLSSTLSTDLFSSVETSRLWPSGVLPKDAYARAVDIVLRRLEIDPWLNEVFDVDSLGGTFDMPDQHLLEINADSLTVPPPGLPYGLALLGRVMNQPQPASGPSAGPSLRVRAASESDPAVRLENQFQTTPLFELISTEADGMGRVNFTAPPNLGTFVVRAYAVTDKAQHGGGEAEVIVRLPLSLTPSVPRIVRVGDEFEAGMIVSLFGTRGKPSPVVATLFADPGASKALEFLSDNGTVLPADSASGAEGVGSCDPGSLSCLAPVTAKTLLTDEDGQVEVRFLFSAVQLGETNLTIRADSGGNSDALQISIPVLAQQEEVQLATSFTIRSDKWEERSEEGLKIPDAVPGTGTLGVAAGVGRLPSVLDLSTRILETRTMVPYGSWALANVTIPAVLRLYGLEQQRTPSGRDIFSRAISAFEEATLNLEISNLTSEIWGLQWVKPRFSEPSRVDTSLNADAIWTANRVVGLLNGEVRELNSGIKRLTKLANVWSSVLERQIVEDARSLSKLGSKIDLATLAWTRLTLGADWSPPRCPSQDSSFCAEATVIEHLSIERLSRNIRNMSVEARAHLALTWLEADKPGHADVAAVVDSFLSDMRVAGRTAYVSARPGEAQPAGLQSQALALLVFVESNSSTQLVEKLANYVGRGGLSNGGFSDSAMAMIASLHALSQYDLSSGSIDPNVALNVSSGSIAILQALFDDPSDPIAESSTPFSALESPPPPLLFETQGTGEVTIVASLEFVPSQLLPFPTYRGIFVERIVQKAGPDNAPSSGPLARVPLATPLVITLQITTPDSLGPVVVRSLMPGGLEPIDPLVDPGAATECTADRLGISYRHWFYPLCPLQETRPSQVTFNYRYLRAGTHAISFQAIASSVGKWMLPPVQAYDEQQPEVMGMSAAGDLFEVCDPSGGDECSEIGADGVRAPSEPPKPCPGNCNGLGLCDLSTGKCLCDSGFSGEDCGSFAEQR